MRPFPAVSGTGPPWTYLRRCTSSIKEPVHPTRRYRIARSTFATMREHEAIPAARHLKVISNIVTFHGVHGGYRPAARRRRRITCRGCETSRFSHDRQGSAHWYLLDQKLRVLTALALGRFGKCCRERLSDRGMTLCAGVKSVGSVKARRNTVFGAPRDQRRADRREWRRLHLRPGPLQRRSRRPLRSGRKEQEHYGRANGDLFPTSPLRART